MAALIISCYTPAAISNSGVTLAWDANVEPDIAGYKVYYGTTSRMYPFPVDAGNLTTQSVSNLQEGLTYYFAATAYNTEGLESDFSTEISHTVPLSERTPASGAIVSSLNPATPGQTVAFTFTALAAASTTNVPSGCVMFRINQGSNSVTLVNGVASIAISNLPAGNHAAIGEYSGDVNFFGATNTLSPDQVINTPPVVRTDQVNRILPNGVKVQVTILLTNDSDADGHALTLSSVSAQSANGASVTRRSSWVYYVALEGVTNTDSFTYSASDALGGTVIGTVNIRIADPQPSRNVTVSEDGGSYRIRFDGTPVVTYRVDFSEVVDPPTWQPLGSRTADQFGIFEIADTPPAGSPPRTYRSVAIH